MFPKKLRNETQQAFSNNERGSSSNYRISDSSYGKNAVKVLHVVHQGAVHSIREFEVGTHLKLYTDKGYITGDNTDIIATDSQKNIVYLLAKKYGIKSPEEFALTLASHFINQYKHVKEVHIQIEELPWQRIGNDSNTGGMLNAYQNSQNHNHAFILTPVAKRYCDVIHNRNDPTPIVMSGIKQLRVIKTTNSSFINFVNDEFRTLPDQHDRIFSTIVESNWEYSTIKNVNFCEAWRKVKDIILSNFAGDPSVGIPSPSVQNTLYLTEKEILDTIPQISSISMHMPNCHYFNFDTSKFQNFVPGENNEVFIPVDKPHGIIYAQLDRKDLSSKL